MFSVLHAGRIEPGDPLRMVARYGCGWLLTCAALDWGDVCWNDCRRKPRHGMVILRLETNRSLSEAKHLYERAGFVEVEPFNNEPYAHHWFQKDLRHE